MKKVKATNIEYFLLETQKEEIYQRVYFQIYEIQELKLRQLETDKQKADFLKVEEFLDKVSNES